MVSKALTQEYDSIDAMLCRKERSRERTARINPVGTEDEKRSGTGRETTRHRSHKYEDETKLTLSNVQDMGYAPSSLLLV